MAREWLGTPYAHQHSTKGHGTDCIGLIRGIYRELYGKEAEIIPAYSQTWNERGVKEMLLEASHRHLVPVDELTDGAVVVFRMKPGRIAKHCGIYTGDNTLIHAMNNKCVEEVTYGDRWSSKHVGTFLFPKE